MCTFLNTLPKKSKSAGTATAKRSLVLSMKPCPDDPQTGEKTWYRFRLLNFASKTTDRDYPFIVRFVHQHWKTNDKGYPEIEDEVTCPVTKWVEWEGNRYDGCPMCRYANQQFIALKESNWKDADARKKNREFGRKYQAIVPVYVVNDPNYEANNGKFKVLIFNDKKFYEEVFIKKVEAQLMKANCFNGDNAVDCCMHMSEVPEVRNEGQPNEYVYKNKVIDKIVFSKTPKTIAAITKEAVDAFPFDETYYVTSTKDELQAFYNKYIKVSNDDIVDEDDEIQVFSKPKNDVPATKTNKVVETKIQNTDINSDDDITDDDLDELATDSDDENKAEIPVASEEPATEVKKADDDDILNDEDLKDLLSM